VHSVAELKIFRPKQISRNSSLAVVATCSKDIEALVIHIDLKGKQLLEKMKIMFGSKPSR
jgi:hypothetical protein